MGQLLLRILPQYYVEVNFVLKGAGQFFLDIFANSQIHIGLLYSHADIYTVHNTHRHTHTHTHTLTEGGLIARVSGEVPEGSGPGLDHGIVSIVE